jgi:beta-galactosidase
LPFIVDVTSVIKLDKDNMIIVRLDNRDNPITGPKPLSKLDFNTYGGVYRNVWLIKKDSLYITHPVYANKIGSGGILITTDVKSDKLALIKVKTHIQNDYEKTKIVEIKHLLFDKNKKIIKSFGDNFFIPGNQDYEVELFANLSSPRFWSPDTPNLYFICTKVYVDNFLVDKVETRFGIREVVIKPEGLLLNGKKTFLRGVNRHQEYPYVGYALSDNAQRRDAYKIKEAGFDYVRASHYPCSPAFLDACDEYGIFVLEPILGWQYFGDKLFEEHAKVSAREMIRNDRNHPCILAWELSINEIRMPKQFINDMKQIGREEFPHKQSYVAGWMKDEYDIYIEARQHRKKIYPEKPLIISEYGDWEYYAMNAGFEQDKWTDLLKDERSSRQARGSGETRLLQQATNIQEAHNDNLSTHAFADGYWVMFDYNRGLANDLELSGIMDIFRIPKFSYYFFKSQRSYQTCSQFSPAIVHIASYWQPFVSQYVRIFSNCDVVELFLDGVSLGVQKPDNNIISRNLCHPPFTFQVKCEKPGKLKAVGYINNKVVASHNVATAGLPEKIKLNIDFSNISPEKNCNDLLFVNATICDANGNQVYNYVGNIHFTLIGDAEIIYNNISKAEAGIAPLLIKVGKNKGKVKITANADNLKKDQISFSVK